MGEGQHCEIERKYLIRYPDIAHLKAQPGAVQWDIVQTYLLAHGQGEVRRVRQVTSEGVVQYYKTFKRRLSDLSAEEDEGLIDAAQYQRYLLEADPARRPVIKTRYRVPYAGHMLEFDIYPFWEDRAILEIELDSEDETAEIPDYVRVIRDVSGEYAYKNSRLAAEVIFEEI